MVWVLGTPKKINKTQRIREVTKNNNNNNQK